MLCENMKYHMKHEIPYEKIRRLRNTRKIDDIMVIYIRRLKFI